MPKEANRDEALRCKEIAMMAKVGGDLPRCIKLLEKSLRLYPDDTVRDLLKTIQLESKKSVPSFNPKSATGTDGSKGPRNPVSDSFTPDQLQEVRRLSKLESYYDILGVDKAANENDVKKAYRKLALKYHPDKSRVPGSEEAFKRISKAFQCLSDPVKRRQYDLSGRDADESIGSAHRSTQEFMSGQDIFDAFFGIPRHRANSGRHMRSETNELWRLLPILLLLGLSVLTSLFQQSSVASPRFSLTPTSEFRYRTATPIMEVSYYAKVDHENSHPLGTTARLDFDRAVESFYLHTLYTDCQYEDRLLQLKIQRARRRGIESEISESLSQTKPSCEKLNSLRAKYPKEFRSRLASWGEF